MRKVFTSHRCKNFSHRLSQTRFPRLHFLLYSIHSGVLLQWLLFQESLSWCCTVITVLVQLTVHITVWKHLLLALNHPAHVTDSHSGCGGTWDCGI